MAIRFSLVDQPWIPCLHPDGSIKHYGLRECLIRAPDILEIFDPSPPVNSALYRLLLVIAHRIHWPENNGEWETSWKSGRFPQEKVEEYFDRWKDRFDLWDEKHPFYQTPGFVTNNLTPVSKLRPEVAGGNNPTLFDHSTDSSPEPLTFAEAAKAIVANQYFALGGGVSATTNFRDCTLAVGANVIVQGDSLFNTILLNLIPKNWKMTGFDAFQDKSDRPAWEADRLPELGKSTMPMGYLDYLTWQSRAIRLIPDEDHPEERVTRMYYAQGYCFDSPPQDPSIPYRENPKLGKLPLKVLEDKDLWRDSHAFLGAREDEGEPPPVIGSIRSLTNAEILPYSDQYRLSIIGLQRDKAKINFWRHERLPLPLALLKEDNLLQYLDEGIQFTDQAWQGLYSACRQLSKFLLKSDDPNSADKEQTKQVQKSLQAGHAYWPTLETPFREFMAALPEDPSARIALWREQVIGQAKSAWMKVTKSLDGSARSMKAVAKGQATLNWKLRELSQEEVKKWT